LTFQRSDISAHDADIAVRELGITGFQGCVLRGSDQLEIMFENPISTEDQAAVGSAIEQYVQDGRSYADAEPAILDLMKSGQQFQEVDYRVGLQQRLHPQIIMGLDGVITTVIYHEQAAFNPATFQIEYTLPVVREDYSYTRDGDGFAQARILSITWYDRARRDHPDTKTRVKLYDTAESIRETSRRRQNIMDQLQVHLLGLLSFMLGYTQREAVTAGQRFFQKHQAEIATFLDIGDELGLIGAVTADRDTDWIAAEVAPGVTIRSVIIDRLEKVRPQ
jgi:hypothetical protein